MSRRALLVHAGVALFLAVVFVPMALLRLIDADEGVYLLYGRYVIHGLVPYRDFPLGQTPLLPYVYGAWMAVFGVSWYSGRLLSAIFAVALGYALYRQVGRETGRPSFGVAAAVMLGASTLAFANYTTVKVLVLPTLLLFLAYVALSSAPIRWRYVLSGLLLGLAVDARSYLVTAAPLFALEARRERQLARFTTGLAVGLVPSAIFLLIDADTYVFNIMGTHALRSDSGLIGAFAQKMKVLGYLLGLHASWGLTSVTSVQFGLLAFANLAVLVATITARKPLRLSMGMSLVVTVVSLLPTPTYVQYFCLPLPFLIVDAAVGAAVLLDRIASMRDGRSRARRWRRVITALIALYVVVAPIDMYWFVVGGLIVPGVYTRANAKNWTIPAVERIGRVIDEEMSPSGGAAISWWPGYFVETRTEIHPKLRNPYTIWYGARIDPSDAARYGLATHADVVTSIRTHAVPLVVLGNMTWDAKDQYRVILTRSGYRLVRQLGDTEIYRVGE